ncbi:enoyl-[acyl-carrier-protein] reductase, mitochondrial [Lycorma delicatula]|uniref:enoyl-[acyl-carrier-protein] reductase, mitochondrial n=1 Tax=Lycorma delicatula TaxID=130591 RepID=UPI003F5119AB
MHSCLNKNLVLFTSIFLKQTTFLRAKDVRYQGDMLNSTGSKLTFFKFGDPNKVVELVEEEPASPKKDEVLVKLVMAPVNPADMNLIQGVYPVKPPLPATPGNEGVGIVEKVGADVKNLAAGDRVVPNAEALGTWRTHGVFKANELFKVRDDIDFVELAGITSNPATAYRMLKDFVNLKPGDTVVQNGANSAAGQNIIQLCKIWGVNTINIVRYRPEIESLKKYLTDLGATYVLSTNEVRTFELKNHPKPILGLNCVGGKIASEVLHFLDHGGTFVTYGGMSRDPVIVPTSALIFRNIKFQGFWMTRWYRENRGNEEHKKMLDDLMEYMKDKKLKAPQYQTVPLKDYRIALMNTLSKQGFIGLKYFLDMRK